MTQGKPDEFAIEFLDEFKKRETKGLAVSTAHALLTSLSGAQAMAMCAIMSGIALRTLVSDEDFEAAVKIFTEAVASAPENMPDLRLPMEERKRKREEQITGVAKKAH